MGKTKTNVKAVEKKPWKNLWDIFFFKATTDGSNEESDENQMKQPISSKKKS